MENEYTTPHMAALQNIQMFVVQMGWMKQNCVITQTLVDDVNEKHFPFYYINAYNAIESNETIDSLNAYKKDKEREPWDEDDDSHIPDIYLQSNVNSLQLYWNIYKHTNIY